MNNEFKKKVKEKLIEIFEKPMQKLEEKYLNDLIKIEDIKNNLYESMNDSNSDRFI